MLRRTVLVMGLLVGSGLVSSGAMAVVRNLEVGGQKMLFTDTDGNGCPGTGDAECHSSVDVMGGNAVGSELTVACTQPVSPTCMQIFGVYQTATYKFNITQFDESNMTGAAQQTFGTFTFDPIHYISADAAVNAGPGGAIGTVHVADRFGISSAFLCNAGTGAAAEVEARTGFALLRDLDLVNCSSCPGTACSADKNTPTHLRLPMVPLPSTDIAACMLYILKDIYVPLVNKKLILSEDNPDHTLGEIDLTMLDACPGRRSPAPTMTESGLLTVALGLLAAGSWVIGRRKAFAESLPLP